MFSVNDIRNKFIQKYLEKDFAENDTLELLNVSFLADEDSIFGSVNKDYIDRELAWYISMSRNVNDIPGNVPKIWQDVSDRNGKINSNYGWCIWSEENGSQYDFCLSSLLNDKSTRQACMIYNRPEMQIDAFDNGMRDFMCTYAVQCFIRNDRLYYHVLMRSNDCWAGYRNDLAWHKHVYNNLFVDLKEKYAELKRQDIYWNAMSLHVYPRQYWMVDCWARFGKYIPKKEYDKLIDK
jgi:thymidylate synthase